MHINVAALILIRSRKILMVTARGRDVIYLPGGKINSQETPMAALLRECLEELSIKLNPNYVRDLFSVEAQAHGEPEGCLVKMQCFQALSADKPRPNNEITALHWVTSRESYRCPPAGVETLRRLVALNLID